MPNGRNAGRLYPVGSQEAQDLHRMAGIALERDEARAAEQEAIERKEVMERRWWAEDAGNVHAKVTFDPNGRGQGQEWWRVEVSNGYVTTSAGCATSEDVMQTAGRLLEEELAKHLDRLIEAAKKEERLP